jgi:hypothetical protein
LDAGASAGVVTHTPNGAHKDGAMHKGH